jgi:peptide/nickel transport system permease protein
VAAFVVRRAALAALVLAGFSFLTFWFFAAEAPPLKGHPVLPEYWHWVRGFGSGRSFHSLLVPDSSLWPVVGPALGHTVILLAGALVLVVALSLAVGVTAARFRRSILDLVVRALSYLAWAIPAFLLALAVQEVVSVVGSGRGLGPFPVAGWPGSCPVGLGLNNGTISPCPAAGTGLRYVANVLRYLTLPTLVLAAGFVGLHGRYLRATLLETLNAPYITTARAKGLPERHVIGRHALRASLATFTGSLLSDFGVIFGATLAVDWVFHLEGLGTVFIREFPTQGFAPIDTYSVQLVLLLAGGLVVLSSLVSEIAVSLLDPRVRPG